MEHITSWPQAFATVGVAFAIATVFCVFFTGRWPWHKD